MLIVGERINASRKAMGTAIAQRDAEAVTRQALLQSKAGADFVDVNAGTFVTEEPEVLQWLVTTIQSSHEIPLCIDSPNPVALEAALRVHRGKALVNSITGEASRFQRVLPLVTEHRCGVVALCIDDAGMPKNAGEAVAKGQRLVEDLLSAGVKPGDIYVDPLVRPVSIDYQAAGSVLDSIRALAGRYPGVHTICGLSNVSYGLPERRLINQAFLVACIVSGMDSAILDPLDQRLMALLRAAELLAGRDKFCGQYLKAYREGNLTGAGGHG